jgi:hypothetical protein
LRSTPRAPSSWFTPTERPWSEYWTDDIDYRAVEGAVDDQGSIHGKDAYRAYVQDWLDTFADFRLEPLEQIAARDEAFEAAGLSE